jgi:acetoin utilization deacetylase AcuC-like enzyme
LKIFYTDHFVLPLPPKHRFPMQKYHRLRRRVLEAALVPPEQMIVPPAATDVEITRVHTPDYLRRVQRGELTAKEVRRMGFPWSPELVERARRSCGGTIAACRTALQDGLAVNLAGGTHHAFPDHGEGYCVFNDSAIAARAVQAEGHARRVLIVDCDVHQGNGTAAIFYGDPTVFTFSIHGAKNFPFRKQKSDLDVELEDGTNDDAYLEALERGLRQALNRASAELVIYLAGADPYKEDRLGRLALSKAGLDQRDRLVLERCRAAGLPVAVTMSGGYAPHIEDTVDIHFQTVQTAVELHRSGSVRSGTKRIQEIFKSEQGR